MDKRGHSTRNQRIDIAKGLLMAIVILGHAIQFIGYHNRQDFWSDQIFIAIYMFHMPLFMAFSGYFAALQAISAGDVLQRVRSLVYPMIPWVTLTAVLRAVAGGDLSSIPMSAWSGFTGTYWFLWCAFLSLIVLWAAQALGRHGPSLYAAVMAVLLLGPEIWLLPMLAFVLPFFVAGHALRSHIGACRRHLRPIIIVALIVTVAAYLVWGNMTYIYNNHAHLTEHPKDVLLMFVGASAATIVAAWGFNRLGTALEGTETGHWISRIGRVTLESYLVQGVVFSASSVFASHIPGAGSDVAGTRWLVSAGVSIVMTAAILLFIEATKRRPALSRFLWGR